jgi:uncharacterized repeat protein (TIGR03803 family)
MAIRQREVVRFKGLVATVVATVVALAYPAPGETLEVLHSFPASVRITSGLVEVAAGEFYGTTVSGGAWSQGSVVKVTTAGAVATLHSFSSNVDGETPLAGLVYDAAGDFLYGTTTSGGQNGRGTVFRIKPDGSSFETVYSFDGSVITDPYSPEAALIKASDGLFYGTSRLGGAYDLGTVFKLDVSATPATVTTLYSFSGGTADGAGPVASLFEGGGYFYGTTAEGGEVPNPGGNPIPLGTVFRISLSGTMDWVTPLVNALNGQSPRGGVVEMGDDFYGTADSGGFWGSGTVFKVTSAGALTKIYDFGNGQRPFAGLTLGADGLLYGTTKNGGANYLGTVFRIDPSATPVVDQTLHSFNGTNGSYPTTGLVKGADGRLFGTTSEGGPGGYGTAYWVQPIFPTSGVFYADPGTEGAGPFPPLYMDGSGALYGTTSVGGYNSGGSIYKIAQCATPPCAMTTLRATQDLGMGQDFSGVVSGPGGFLYGTTKDSNSVYKIQPDGSGFQTLYTFTGSPGNFPNGSFPIGVTELGGILYGATATGGASDKGTLFKLDPASPSSLGWSTSLSGSNGRYPAAPLVAGADGKLYGTASAGGASDKGTLFRVTTGGTYELLYSFSGPDGSNPWAALTPAGPGVFYGTTAFGGAHGVGTFFRLDATATPVTVTTLRHFAAGEVEGVSVLTLGNDGNLYGTSSGWGAHGLGSVILLAPGGALQILHSFSGSDGAYPLGGVLRLFDGTLLGTAEMAGPKDGGVVFRLTVATSSATATVSGGGVTGCGGGSVQIRAALTGTPPWSLTWSDGVTQSGLLTSPATRTVSPASTTIYTLTAFSDANGQGTASGRATVTVSLAPAPVVTSAWVRVPTNGWTVNVPLVAGRSWSWSVSSNGTIVSGQGTNSIFVTRAASGAIDISVVETVTATGCSGTGTARVGSVRRPY